MHFVSSCSVTLAVKWCGAYEYTACEHTNFTEWNHLDFGICSDTTMSSTHLISYLTLTCVNSAHNFEM